MDVKERIVNKTGIPDKELEKVSAYYYILKKYFFLFTLKILV